MSFFIATSHRTHAAHRRVRGHWVVRDVDDRASFRHAGSRPTLLSSAWHRSDHPKSIITRAATAKSAHPMYAATCTLGPMRVRFLGYQSAHEIEVPLALQFLSLGSQRQELSCVGTRLCHRAAQVLPKTFAGIRPKGPIPANCTRARTSDMRVATVPMQ